MKRVVASIAAVGLLMSACGGNDDDSANAQPPESAAGDPQGTAEVATTDAVVGVGDSAVTTEVLATTTVAADDDETPRYGGTLRVPLTTAPEPLHPLRVRAIFTQHVVVGIYDNMLELDESSALQPGLATGYDTPDGGRTWVFQLRDGVTFHDGTPLDADAVAAFHRQLMDPANQCVCLGRLALLESVEATGPLEVTYHLSAPSGAFPTEFAGGFGMIAKPGLAPEDDPIGTGPFVFVSSDGQTIELARNDDYWQADLPYLDGVVFNVLPDVDSQIAALKAGDVDFSALPNDRLTAVEGDDSVVRVRYGGFGSQFINFQVQKPPFDDHRARLAVAQALDLVTLHETFNNGAVQPATSLYPRSSWAYPGEIDGYPTYDLEGAKALVEELGGLSFALLAPQHYQSLIVPIQAMLTAAGMDVEIDVRENAAAIDAYRGNNFQAVLFGYSASADPHDFTTIYETGSRLNSGLYSNPEMDALIREASTTVDQDARAAIYGQVAELAAAELPLLLINNFDDSFAVRSVVRGVQVIGDGIWRPDTVWLDE